MTEPESPKPPADTSWVQMEEISESRKPATRTVGNSGFAVLFVSAAFLAGEFWQATLNQGLPVWFQVVGAALSWAVLYVCLKARIDRAARRAR